jgi:hypothetical protein
MLEFFEYRLIASAGYTRAKLSLAEDTAQLEYRQASMGQVLVHYLLQCQHECYSEFHGLLTVTQVEQYPAIANTAGADDISPIKEVIHLGRLIDPTADEELLEMLNTFQMEYIRLPQPQRRLDEPGGNYGIHDWTDSFSLVVLIHAAYFLAIEDDTFQHTPLGEGLLALDKLHFAQIGKQ